MWRAVPALGLGLLFAGCYLAHERADGARPHRVVLEPIGERIGIDDSGAVPGALGGTPFLAWNGGGWGAGWDAGAALRVRLLDEDGVPIGPSQEIALEPSDPVLEYAVGLYAVVTAGRSSSALRLFDGVFHPASPAIPFPPANHGDVARIEPAHQWVVALRDRTSNDIVVAAVGDDFEEPSPRITLRLEHDDDIAESGVVVAALETRAVVAWVGPTSVQAAVFTGAPLTQVSPILDIAPFARVHNREDVGLRLRPVGDHITLAAPDGLQVVTFSIDPWTGTSRGPTVVGPSFVIDRAPGIAPMPEHEMYGVCWASSNRMGGGVSLRVLDENGVPLSDVFDVVSNLRNVGGVDCGWNGTDFVILWWRAGGDNELFSERVHARFE